MWFIGLACVFMPGVLHFLGSGIYFEKVNLILTNKEIDIFSTNDLSKDLTSKAVRGGAVIMAAEICSSVLRIASIAVLARLLIPEDFGLIAMVTALTVFAERFKDVGLGDATVQARNINHEQASSLFWINFSICIGIALILACLSKAVAWFYKDPRLTAITIVIASTFLFSGLVIQHQALLRRRFCFGKLALIQVSSIFLSLFVAIILAYSGFGYWALVAREFSRAVFVVIGTWLTCPWIPGLPKRRTGIAPLLTFGKNVTGFNLAYFFSRSFDKILLGRLHGPYWVGLYTNAFQLISLPINQIKYPVNVVALPAFSALQSEPPAFCSYFQKTVHLLTFVCMPVVVFLAVFADVIIDLILGPQWAKAVPIFQILAVGAFIEPILHPVGPAMVALGRTGEYFRLGLLESVLLLVCFSFGSIWGVMGLVAGYTISVYFSLIARFVYGLKQTPIKIIPIVRTIATNGGITIIFALILIFARYLAGWDFLPQWLIAFIMGGASIYILIWIFIPGGKQMLCGYCSYAKNVFTTGK